MLAGIRVRPADLSRLLGVSKQAVSAWVKDGRIILGADGRVDPRDAVNRLIATGNPARLRALFLKPLVTELDSARRRIRDLEQTCIDAKDDAKFNEESASGLLEVFDVLGNLLEAEWQAICEQPSSRGLLALKAWLDYSLEHGVDHGRGIMDMVECTEPVDAQTDEQFA